MIYGQTFKIKCLRLALSKTDVDESRLSCARGVCAIESQRKLLTEGGISLTALGDEKKPGCVGDYLIELSAKCELTGILFT